MTTAPWKSIWAVDFEFAGKDGDTPRPLCVVAHDLLSGRWTRQWLDGESAPGCPYGTGPDDLVIAYYASAEIGCHLALGWPIPQRIIDLCAEFKRATSGLEFTAGKGLIGALLYHGITGNVAAQEKAEMQALAARGGPYTDAQRQALLIYCESDVQALRRLWPAMAADIDVPRALIRGRYMAALAQVERNGIPIDMAALTALRDGWDKLKPQLISEVDGQYGIYDGERFSQERFSQYLAAQKIPWPRTPTGQLSLADDTFKDQAKLHPCLQPLRELRATIYPPQTLRSGGRRRWTKPDDTQRLQEQDRTQPTIQHEIHLRTGDMGAASHPDRTRTRPRLQRLRPARIRRRRRTLGRRRHARGLPLRRPLPHLRTHGRGRAGGRDQTHPRQRTRPLQTLRPRRAIRHGRRNPRRLPRPAARLRTRPPQTTQTHLPTILAVGERRRKLVAAFGWQINVSPATKATTLQNWPCQAAGAEMLRLAVIGAVEHGIKVCAPVHDALLIEAADHDIDAAVELTQHIMGQASRAVLHGTTVQTDAKIIRHPDRYEEERGAVIWQKLHALLPDLSSAGTATCAA